MTPARSGRPPHQKKVVGKSARPAPKAPPKPAPKTAAKSAAKVAPRGASGKNAPRKKKGVAPLQKLVTDALTDMKAVNIQVLDVRGLTDVADTMIVASGNSDRHVKAIADRVIQNVKASGKRPFGVEGARGGEWVLVDLSDVILHVMLPRVREHYGLEELWETAAAGASRRE